MIAYIQYQKVYKLLNHFIYLLFNLKKTKNEISNNRRFKIE